MQFKPITAIIVLSLIVSVVLMAGCSPPINSDMSVTVKSVALSQQDQLAANKTGYKFVAYNCTVTNTSTKSRSVGYNSWELQDGGFYAPALATNVTGAEWSQNNTGKLVESHYFKSGRCTKRYCRF